VLETAIHFFREDDGSVPFKEWLEELAARHAKAHKKCLAYLLQLRAEGHVLRRPIAAPLRDGVYELRPSYQGVHYRILYGFVGTGLVVVSHGTTKEDRVPSAEIDRAARRLAAYRKDPRKHSYPEDILNG
jgi:phage-related protein